MVAALEWIEGFSDDVQRRDVPTVEELDRVLDELTARARQAGIPFNVSLTHVDATVMVIVLGADVAYVEWIRLQPWCCLGCGREASTSLHDDELLVFAGNGQYSELPRRMWIDVPRAREAVRHYYMMRELSPLVAWTVI
ncbi:Imm1 family immunity protein [Micromonospora sp. NPDC018662]|uniref:Imm1 family immunity protein n=1 Tax=Micromonospora sp. NPDC018662 TaxID=3364238 RepID=UPI0037B43336